MKDENNGVIDIVNVFDFTVNAIVAVAVAAADVVIA